MPDPTGVEYFSAIDESMYVDTEYIKVNNGYIPYYIFSVRKYDIVCYTFRFVYKICANY